MNYIKLKPLITEEYWGTAGAGALIFSKKTKRFLLGLRSSEVEEPGTWGIFGGKIDQDESPTEAVNRELYEELGLYDNYELIPLCVFKDGEFKYYNYLATVNDEFTPDLNMETDKVEWIKFGEWPSPLHFGMEYILKVAGNKLKEISTSISEDLDAPPAQVVPAVPKSKRNLMTSQQLLDAYIVVATLYGEARGEGKEGMQAVMNVIINRAKKNPDKFRSIVLSPKQFSIWNNVSDPEQFTRDLVSNAQNKTLKDLHSYKMAVDLVDKAIKGNLPDITNGALFYFNPKLANPSWAKKLKFIKRIGNHDFYGVPGK